MSDNSKLAARITKQMETLVDCFEDQGVSEEGRELHEVLESCLCLAHSATSSDAKFNCVLCHDTGQIPVGTSGDDSDGNATVFEPCDCEPRATSSDVVKKGLNCKNWRNGECLCGECATSSDALVVDLAEQIDILNSGFKLTSSAAGELQDPRDLYLRAINALNTATSSDDIMISRECASRLLSLVRENKAETPYVAEFENWGSLEKQLKAALEKA